MINANDAPWERAEHFYDGEGVACGKNRRTSSTRDRTCVDCKRCLASLAKRDRAFQRKARGWFGSAKQWAHFARTIGLDGAWGQRAIGSRKAAAARAIAAEEGCP